jgi:hypothetical protein
MESRDVVTALDAGSVGPLADDPPTFASSDRADGVPSSIVDSPDVPLLDAVVPTNADLSDNPLESPDVAPPSIPDSPDRPIDPPSGIEAVPDGGAPAQAGGIACSLDLAAMAEADANSESPVVSIPDTPAASEFPPVTAEAADPSNPESVDLPTVAETGESREIDSVTGHAVDVSPLPEAPVPSVLPSDAIDSVNPPPASAEAASAVDTTVPEEARSISPPPEPDSDAASDAPPLSLSAPPDGVEVISVAEPDLSVKDPAASASVPPDLPRPGTPPLSPLPPPPERAPLTGAAPAEDPVDELMRRFPPAARPSEIALKALHSPPAAEHAIVPLDLTEAISDRKSVV